jgi:uncharacterized protein DUF433
VTTEALLKRITIDPEICHGKPCIRSLSDDKPSPVLVHPKVAVRQPGLTVSAIELLYPERTISISIAESKENGNSISISEVLKTD